LDARLRRVAAALFVALLLPANAYALEKRAVAFDGDPANDWNARSTVRCSYYNICTGWVWCWSGFGDGGRIGQVFDNCHGASLNLLASTHFTCVGAPPGYGFTGTIAVHTVDANECPTEIPLCSQPFLPGGLNGSQIQYVPWGIFPFPYTKFAIVVTMKNGIDGLENPTQIGTDHPANGPTGPAACGVCYPANRETHSYSYGTIDSPLCPGSMFNDGVCSAELFWEAHIAGENQQGVGVDDISIQSSTWGAIKSLYR
jgi:hypothetical protein